MDPTPRVRTIVLAAGAGSRFGGRKLGAGLDGKPVLQHVLDALAGAGLDDPIVVVGPIVPGGLDLRRGAAIVNPEPARGLSSSLRIGWAAALDVEPAPDAILVALGDQPLVRADVIEQLAQAPLDSGRPILAPRYTGTTARNPVRLEAAAGRFVNAATGDRGLGPVLDANPGLVRWIDVAGDNPDVDTTADLARLAELVWSDRVRRNREQVDRFREQPDGPDFYASVSSIFRDDPDRVGDPVLEALRRHVQPGDAVLDIGAGAGRYALPLARSVREVIALDPSRSMLAALREAMAALAIDNVHVVEGRWPGALDADVTLAGFLPADVSLIAHVGYDVEAIGPFVEAMERATRRACLAVLMERSPATIAEPFWPPLHGEPRIALPGLPAFVDLLAARGREPALEMLESSRRRWASRDEVEAYVRRQTWVAPGTEKDRRMQALLDDWLMTTEDGALDLSVAEPLRVGLVGWRPG